MTSATTSPAFQLDKSAAGTLAVSGELSFDTAAAALQAIQSALEAGQVERLDLTKVSRSDSAGLACMLAVLAGVSRRGQVLAVTGMPAGMQALAQVCEVDSLIA